MDNKVSFEVMGLDSITSDYLNWALQYRNNLEWFKDMKTMELKSASATMFFDGNGFITRVAFFSKIFLYILG